MKAHELLSSPDKWTQGANARSESGASVHQTSPGAIKWNLYGSMARCYPDLENRCCQWFIMQKDMRHVLNYDTICEWADKPERTWQEVHDLLFKLDI